MYTAAFLRFAADCRGWRLLSKCCRLCMEQFQNGDWKILYKRSLWHKTEISEGSLYLKCVIDETEVPLVHLYYLEISNDFFPAWLRLPDISTSQLVLSKWDRCSAEIERVAITCHSSHAISKKKCICFSLAYEKQVGSGPVSARWWIWNRTKPKLCIGSVCIWKLMAYMNWDREGKWQETTETEIIYITPHLYFQKTQS